MKNKQDFILQASYVGAWIIFIGLSIEAGAILFNFIYTLFNPIAAQNIYNGLNLSSLYHTAFGHYVAVMSFAVLIAIMKAYLFFLVIWVFMKLNLVQPFSTDIAALISKMSTEALSIAAISFVARQYAKRLLQKGLDLDIVGKYWADAGTLVFLMMAAILYIIAQIFYKGIALQKENDLTV
ncbi:MAG: DUF2975 domain-containing protein [Chitinophagaceae bacterium]